MKKRTKIMLILSVVSAILTVALGAGMAFMATNNVIGINGREAMLQNQMELLMDRYSIWAVSDAKNNFNMDAIKQTNLHLGVIAGEDDNFADVDLTDTTKYVVQNFDDNFDPENVHIFQTYVDKYTRFGYDMSSIWGYARIWHEGNPANVVGEVPVEGLCYDWMTKKLYFEGVDEELYLFEGEYVINNYNSNAFETENGDVIELSGENIENCIDIKTHDKWIDPYCLLYLPRYDYQISLGEVEIIDDFSLREKEIINGDIIEIAAGSILVQIDKNNPDDATKKYYYVVSYLNDPLVSHKDAAWNDKDLFLQANKIYNAMYDWKYIVIGVFSIAVAVLMICGIYWFCKCIALIIRMFGRIKLMWKLGLVLFCGFWMLLFLEFLDNAGAVMVMFLYIFVACPIVIYLGWSYKKQVEACGELAKGNLSAKVDTKHLLGELKKQGENINAIGDSITLAVDERMKSERMKAELITNVSHDIKTPLTSIINYVDLLGKEEIESENAKDYIEVLSRQSDKLKKLIVDLIEASKASTGNLEIHVEEIDARMALMQIAGEYEEKLQSNNIELVVNAPEGSVPIMADGRYLFRIFDNLLVNIQKYSLSNTRAYIDLTSDQSNIMIAFKNISKEPLNANGEEFMERFYRGDASRNTEGNGLGLAIVKSLTELLGGKVSVSVDGDLFKVTLKFPVFKPEIEV